MTVAAEEEEGTEEAVGMGVEEAEEAAGVAVPSSATMPGNRFFSASIIAVLLCLSRSAGSAPRDRKIVG